MATEHELTYDGCKYRCYLKEVKGRKRPYPRVFCGKVDRKCKVGISSASVKVKQPWEMTKAEFMANPPAEVDIYLVDATGKRLSPLRGKIGQTVDITGEVTKGYRVANTITPFDVAYDNIVKFALQEGKPVPPEVAREFKLVVPVPYASITKSSHPKDIFFRGQFLTTTRNRAYANFIAEAKKRLSTVAAKRRHLEQAWLYENLHRLQEERLISDAEHRDGVKVVDRIIYWLEHE